LGSGCARVTLEPGEITRLDFGLDILKIVRQPTDPIHHAMDDRLIEPGQLSGGFRARIWYMAYCSPISCS